MPTDSQPLDQHTNSGPGACSEDGFTLVELLVVLVILVLLASIVGPRIMGYLGGSRTKTARVQIENLSAAVELFALDVGRYPTTGEALAALVRRPGNVSGWNGPYLVKAAVPPDPWGRAYVYRFPGSRNAFDIVSTGRDGREGGEGEDADVSN